MSEMLIPPFQPKAARSRHVVANFRFIIQFAGEGAKL